MASTSLFFVEQPVRNTDEQGSYDNNGVKVTNTRFIVDASTYSIRNITSTAAWSRSQKWMLGSILILIGLASFTSSVPLAAILLMAGALAFYLGRPVYYVRLNTSSGEVQAVKSHDIEYVKQVVQALNEAIISQHKSPA